MPLCGSSRNCGCSLTAPGMMLSGSGVAGDPWILEGSPRVVANVGARPSPVPYIGFLIYQIDVGRHFVWTGSAWRGFGFSDWTDVTPSWTNVTLGTGGTNAGRYRYEGDCIRYSGEMDLGTGGSITGDVALAMPASLSPTGYAQGRTVGHGMFMDAAVRGYQLSWRIKGGTSVLTPYHTESGNLGVVNGTNPFTGGVDDQIEWDVLVEVE